VTTYREDLEGWLRESLPSHPRERAMEEAARALVKGGLEGNLTWAQIDDAMTGLRYDQEPEVRNGPRPDLAGEERVALESRGEADYRMTVEIQGAHEREQAERDAAEQEVERDTESEQEAER
jgi:hypothetical protein